MLLKEKKGIVIIIIIIISTLRRREPVELRNQILLTLWVLENPECLRSVADRFDVCKSKAYQVYKRVCRAVVTHLTGECIKFPIGASAQEVMGAFEGKKRYPRCLE